jgi:hypothetical protein
VDSILEATKLFNELLLLVNSIPKVVKLFDEALFLANSILEAIRLFGKAFFLINFTLKVAKLSFELKTTKLFKKFYFFRSCSKSYKAKLRILSTSLVYKCENAKSSYRR